MPTDPAPPLDAPLTAEEARRTMLDLDEIERRADAASPGPWGVWTSMDNTYDILSEAVHPHEALAGLYGRAQTDHPTPQEDADAAFIAASRTDVPALIAELRRLRAVEQERDALRTALAEVDVLLEGAGLGSRYRALQIIHAALEAAGDPARGAGEADA